MKTPAANLKILKVTHVRKYLLALEFSDGARREIDFQPFLESSRNPEIRKFLDLGLFRKFSLRDGELMWGDFDLIFPLMDLYNSELGANA